MSVFNGRGDFLGKRLGELNVEIKGLGQTVPKYLRIFTYLLILLFL